ncbi:MAG TPA: RNA polymerase sigma factor [Opitutaceae bacterium]|jgi:RNA polymerase sigma-70 factor (ECF subfamily)|nr:RNA polymerase sigma factor [Opitutaceae bacterium]
MPEDKPGQGEFSFLYRTTLAPLRRYLTRLLGNASEAQDVAHDAYIRVYPSLTDNTARQPAALLYTAARRLAINRLKRRSISPVARDAFIPEMSASSEPSVETQVIAKQELTILEEAIADLPEGCRTVLLLCKIEQLSHKQISERLSIAVSTVEKQHARALRLLRAALEGKFES